MSELTNALRSVGRQYVKSKAKTTRLGDDLGRLIWQAQEDGVSISTIAELTGLPKTNVHYFINREARDRGQDPRNTRIREWLREQGHQVTNRGDLSESLVQDYENWVKNQKGKK